MDLGITMVKLLSPRLVSQLPVPGAFSPAFPQVMNSYVEVVDRMDKRDRDNAMTQARIAREELASAQAAAAKSAEELSRAVKEIKRLGSELDQEKKKSQDPKAGLALKETEMSEKLTLLKSHSEKVLHSLRPFGPSSSSSFYIIFFHSLKSHSSSTFFSFSAGVISQVVRIKWAPSICISLL